MKAGLLFALTLTCVLITACSHGDGERVEPTISADHTTTGIDLAELKPILPAGWSLKDWRVSTDRRYVLLDLLRLPRVDRGGISPPNGAVSLYRRYAPGSFVELARIMTEAGIPPDANLDPVSDGSRLLRLDGRWNVSISASNERAALSGVDGGYEVDIPSEPSALVPTTRGVDGDYLPAGNGPLPVAATKLLGWDVERAWAAPDGITFLVLVIGRFPLGTSSLSVYRLEGSTVREVWRESNTYVRLESKSWAWRDLNADGTLDFAYLTAAAGTGWTWGQTLGASLGADGVIRDINFVLPIQRMVLEGPQDLNGDGVSEWLALDASWEAFISHPDSPVSTFVLAWDGGQYVDASSEFGDEILRRGRACAWATSCTVLTTTVSHYLDYCNAGRTTEAIAAVQELEELAVPTELAERKEAALDRIATDPYRRACRRQASGPPTTP